jgi:hypothetical protein
MNAQQIERNYKECRDRLLAAGFVETNRLMDRVRPVFECGYVVVDLSGTESRIFVKNHDGNLGLAIARRVTPRGTRGLVDRAIVASRRFQRRRTGMPGHF